jgi:glutamate-1-semialdehyde 2,1-aminomutase
MSSEDSSIGKSFLNLSTWKQAVLIAVAPFALIWVYKRALTLRCIDPTNIGARYAAGILKSYSFDDDEFFSSDGAPAEIAELRKAGFSKLGERFKMKAGGDMERIEAELADGLSDIRFTDTNRVPFPFQKQVRANLKVASIVDKSVGPVLVDFDGNEMLDVSGSYGVNVAGYDVYKGFIDRGWERVRDLGPNVLGPVHPVIMDVITPLRKISGLDEVSFHMSGTEAVMAAVRLVRFNTRRSLVVTFGGAYHGWWDGMQPGAGNERFTNDVLSVKDMNPASLAMIKARASEIAAVLISPLQGLNPGKPPPSDLVLMDSKMRETNERIKDYTDWLHEIRKVCTEYNIPLIFDEVYTGFRMRPGGAQEFYNIQADMVVYGKTLGGGMPVGVVCGKKSLMHRFDEKHPLRVNYVIGTFAAAPITLGAMAEFLKWQSKPETVALYSEAEKKVDKFIMDTNKEFISHNLPMRVDSLTTVWTVLFNQPGRYHWMFQYYLRAEGLALSWVGTGRCLFSLDFSDDQYEQTKLALLRAGVKMQQDGWWWQGDESNPLNSKTIKNRMMKEIVTTLVGLRK